MAFLNDSLSLTILLTFLILILIYEDFEQVQLGSVEFCFKNMIPVIKNFTYMATKKRLKEYKKYSSINKSNTVLIPVCALCTL